MELTDLDGDGDLDLLKARFNRDDSGEVVWQLNDGTGAFGDESRQALPSDANVFLGDINGDGALDAISRKDGDYVWFQNNIAGSGRFEITAQTIVEINSLRLTEVVDLNQDGRDDFLMTERSTETRDRNLVWLENQGDTFEKHGLTTVEADGPFDTVLTSDINGDGDLDLIHFSDRVSLIENVGGDASSTTFSTPVAMDWSPGDDRFEAFDVDRDGDQDILIRPKSNFWGVTHSWSENVDGKYQSPDILHTFGSQEGRNVPINTYFLFDVDGDGHEEMISKDRTNGKLAWFPDIREPTVNYADIPSGFQHAIGDMDGDNDLDWVASNLNGDNIDWYDGIADESEANVVTSTDFLGATDLTAVDMDGDGDNDVVFKSQGGLLWYENAGNGDFKSMGTLLEELPGYSFDIVDLNGDAWMDIAYRYYDDATEQSLSVWHPNSSTGMGAANTLTNDWIGDYLDVDGDGDVDYSTFAPNAIELHMNDGNGNFPTTISLETKGEFEFSAVDVDGDGDQDLISSKNGVIALYDNTGDGNYERHVIATASRESGFNGQPDILLFLSYQLEDTKLADADGDGDADLFMLHDSSLRPLNEGGGFVQRIEILENVDGEFQSTPGVTIFGLTNSRELQLADLDADGDLDIVTSTHQGAMYFENLGDLQYESSRSVSLNNAHRSTRELEIADMDGDGLPDFIEIMSNENRISWQRNELTSGTVLITPVEIDKLYAAIREGSTDERHDWNDDGVVDVADVDYLLEEVVGTVHGDTNLDGRVDFQDLLNVFGTFGRSGGGWAGGDFDGDGEVGFSEFLTIFENFGFDYDDQFVE